MNLWDTDRGHNIAMQANMSLKSIAESLSTLVSIEQNKLNMMQSILDRMDAAASNNSNPTSSEKTAVEEIISNEMAKTWLTFSDWIAELDDVMSAIKKLRRTSYDNLVDSGFNGYLKDIQKSPDMPSLLWLTKSVTYEMSKYLSSQDYTARKSMLETGKIPATDLGDAFKKRYDELEN